MIDSLLHIIYCNVFYSATQFCTQRILQMHNKLNMYQPVMEIFNNYKRNQIFDLHVISAKCLSQMYKILLVASFFLY